MQAALDWLSKNHEEIVRGLADLVAIPSISTDGEHHAEIDRTAKLTCDQMRQAGLHNVEVLQVGGSLPYAYGEWLDAPRQADRLPVRPPRRAAGQLRRAVAVRPVEADAPRRPALRPRLGRRQGGDLRAPRRRSPRTARPATRCRCNVKMLVEGEEEVGSKNLMKFFDVHKDRLKSDVIVVCDTENIEVGLPSITYSLRGIVAVQVEVTTAKMPVHSGMGGGGAAGRGHRAERDPRPALLGQRPAADPGLLRPGPPADRQGAGRVPQAAVRRRRSSAQAIGMVPSARFATGEGLQRLRADVAAAGGHGHRPGGQLASRGRRTRCCRRRRRS